MRSNKKTQYSLLKIINTFFTCAIFALLVYSIVTSLQFFNINKIAVGKIVQLKSKIEESNPNFKICKTEEYINKKLVDAKTKSDTIAITKMIMENLNDLANVYIHGNENKDSSDLNFYNPIFIDLLIGDSNAVVFVNKDKTQLKKSILDSTVLGPKEGKKLLGRYLSAKNFPDSIIPVKYPYPNKTKKSRIKYNSSLNCIIGCGIYETELQQKLKTIELEKSRKNSITTALFGILIFVILGLIFFRWIKKSVSNDIAILGNFFFEHGGRFQLDTLVTSEKIKLAEFKRIAAYANELIKKNKEFRQYLNTDNVVFFMDSKTEIFYVNKKFQEIFQKNVKLKEPLGKKFYELSDNPDINNVFKKINLTRESRSYELIVNGKHRKTDITPIVKENQIVGFVAIDMDINELKQARKKAEELNMTRNILYSIMSHDIYGRFATLNNLIDTFNFKFSEKNQQTSNYLFELLNKTQELSRGIFITLKNLLDWTGKDFEQVSLTPNYMNVSLEEIENSLENMKIEAKAKKLDLSCDFSKTSFITCDKNMIETILRNLISNSIKFTDNGYIRVFSEIENDYYKITVKDSGLGIPVERQNEIFNIDTEQVNVDANLMSNRKGKGLGLFFCKKLIKAHKGNIGVVSKFGEGSLFWFTIPIMQK